MADVDYTPEQRSRNQLSIVLTAGIVLGVVLISGRLQGWPLGSFVVAMGFVVLVAMAFWKVFGSRSARPLPTGKAYARNPHFSQQQLDKMARRPKGQGQS